MQARANEARPADDFLFKNVFQFFPSRNIRIYQKEKGLKAALSYFIANKITQQLKVLNPFVLLLLHYFLFELTYKSQAF